MVIVDGQFFQVRGDRSVREIRDNVLSPVRGIVTAFSADQAINLDYCPDLSHLTSKFDAPVLFNWQKPSNRLDQKGSGNQQMNLFIIRR
jgi:alpha-acetolactate decarboxylase